MRYMIGRTVLIVYDDKRLGDPFETRVIKIGRKWVALAYGGGRYRFDIKTGRVYYGDRAVYARVYESRAAYDAERAREDAWRGVREAANAYAFRAFPPHLTADEMDRIADMIRGPK